MSKFYISDLHLGHKNVIKHDGYNVGCMLDYMNYIPRTFEEIRRGNNYK